MNKERNTVVHYNDISLFLVLIPFINALNYYLTYSHISFNWHTAITFVIDTLQGFAAWTIIRNIVKQLDKKLPYSSKPLKRILLQIAVTSLAGLGVIIVTTEIINAIAKPTPVPSSFYSFDIFIFLIWFFVINGIYIGLYYYTVWNESERLRQEEVKMRELEKNIHEEEKKIRQEGFMVKQGKQNINIPFSDIAGLYIEGEYAVLVTRQGKKHLLDESLDKVEKSLPSEIFFRLNRQYILHRSIVTGYERSENSKINIFVKATDHFPTTIPVSRTKAPAFKLWFHPDN